MNKKLTVLLVLMAIIVLFSAGCSGKTPDQTGKEAPKADGKVLAAVKTNSPITIDGVSEEAWNAAEAFKVKLANGGTLQGSGGNFTDGKTEVSIKALYDTDNFFMQFQWADPTQSLARGPWIKENGKLVLKPYSEYYEDKFAVLWNINDSVQGFDKKGCAITCHVTDFKDDSGKSIIKHFTNGANELIDIWHWKSTRQNSLYGPDKPGLMHDQFMDNAQFDPADKKKEGAGRHSDPGEKEYHANKTEAGVPELVLDGESKNGNPYVIVEGLDPVKPFTPDYVAKMAEGDFIPGAIAKQISGDPADITAKAKWENGVWTLETQRKLVTASEKDIQFKDLSKEYYFAVSAFDNSQIGHAYQAGAQKLQFK